MLLSFLWSNGIFIIFFINDFRHPKKIAVIILKFEWYGLLREMGLKDADGMANALTRAH